MKFSITRKTNFKRHLSKEFGRQEKTRALCSTERAGTAGKALEKQGAQTTANI